MKMLKIMPADFRHAYQQRMRKRRRVEISGIKMYSGECRFNSVAIRCNLINGSYIYGSLTDIAHSFSPSVPPGYLMNVQLRNLIYLPNAHQPAIDNIPADYPHH